MSNIDDEITSIKRRLEAAQVAKVRHQATKEAAQIQYDEAMQQLRETFDVDSPEGIRAKLAALQDELDTKLEEINNSLNSLNL